MRECVGANVSGRADERFAASRSRTSGSLSNVQLVWLRLVRLRIGHRRRPVRQVGLRLVVRLVLVGLLGFKLLWFGFRLGLVKRDEQADGERERRLDAQRRPRVPPGSGFQKFFQNY